MTPAEIRETLKSIGKKSRPLPSAAVAALVGCSVDELSKLRMLGGADTESLGYFKTKHGGWDTFYIFHGGLNSNDREGTSSYSTSGNPLGDQVAVGRIVRRPAVDPEPSGAR